MYHERRWGHGARRNKNPLEGMRFLDAWGHIYGIYGELTRITTVAPGLQIAQRRSCLYTLGPNVGLIYQQPPNYPLRDPKYHLMETIRPLIEVHWGSRYTLGAIE